MKLTNVVSYKHRYLSKKKWNRLTDKKFKLRKRFFYHFENKSFSGIKTSIIPRRVFKKYEFIFWLVINYKLYVMVRPYFNRTIISFKFLKRINILFAKNVKNFIKINKSEMRVLPINFNTLNNFILLYNYFFRTLYKSIFHFFKKMKRKKRFYKFILIFQKNKLFLNMQNPLKKNIFSLSPGLLIKFFEKRKSMKKGKILKFLLIKYVRKLLLITRIRHMILIIKKTPNLLLEFINLINQNISHKFVNPFNEKTIEEKPSDFVLFKFTHFVFLKNQSFVKNKQKKKGRVKRKVLQKIIFENQIID